MKNNIAPVIKPLFYETGAKKTVPICPMDCVAWFHPYVSVHSYNPGDKSCKIKATQALPFFVDNFGPKWTEFTTTAHEQLPGHHLEVSYFQYSQVLGKNSLLYWSRILPHSRHCLCNQLKLLALFPV